MSQHKITINDVAQAAGVSVTTVSLVLSGKGRISGATAERVNQAIDTLGYVRNRSAVMLRGGESGVVGLIVRDLSDPFYAEMTAGLSEHLEQHGKVLFLTQSGSEGQHLQRCVDSLITQGVDGVVLGGNAQHAAEIIRQAQEQHIALVCASRASQADNVDTIRPDNAMAARIATEHLIRQGHQCIAWIGGNSASLMRAERLGGFCTTLLQYGLPFRPEWIIECGNEQKEGAEAAANLLQQHPRLTAILAYNASTALGCYFGLLRTGRAIGRGVLDSYYGQQVALLGFGDEPQAALTDPPLTFVTSSAREIGRAAGARMIQRLAEPLAAAQHLIMPPALVIRGSA